MHKWSGSLSVGNETIDAEHQAIFNLYELFWEDAPLDAVEAFEIVNGSVTIHFEHEEGLMERVGFPEDKVESHKTAHRELQDAFLGCVTRVKDDPEGRQVLLDFLMERLIPHIQSHDRQLAEHVKAGWQVP